MASSPTVFFFFLVLSLAAEWCQSLPAVAREEHAAENNCVHRMPKVGDSPAHVELEPRHRLVKRSLEHQMRIKVFYHESVERLGRQQRSIVKKVVPDAVSYWESVLKVRRNLATIRMNRKCENNQFFLGPDDPTQYCRNRCVATTCGEVDVPPAHLGPCHTCNSDGRDCELVEAEAEGIDQADFVLYVSALQTRQCGETIGRDASTVAYAAHCQQESAFDRPIAGHTNICVAAIKNGTREDVAALESTIRHELLHALGFSSSLFAFFRDKDGEPLTEREEDGKPPINRRKQIRQWSERVIKKIERPWLVRSGTKTRTVDVMVTPRVVEEVRNHFGCPTLLGAELEDQGGEGTALTHWEKRVFQNEAMTGTVHTKNPVYSRITFALLEDSGWYLPNYDMADEIVWGRGLGCDFAELSCKQLMESKDGHKYPFCSTLMAGSSSTHCTADGTSVGSCNLVKFSSYVPEIYQNFDEVDGVNSRDVGKVGSSVTLADFCPYIQEFSWKSTPKSKSRGTRCDDPDNNPEKKNNFALESYKSGSRCFQQGSKWNQKSCNALKQWQRFGAGCYPYRCVDGRVNIVVRGNVSLACLREGEEIKVSLMQGEWLHDGSLLCPRCEDHCDDCRNKTERIDPQTLMEELDEDSCFQSGLGNVLGGFIKDFGLSLGVA